jgi:hydrogenase nickel incorporation protein HypA/HybF
MHEVGIAASVLDAVRTEVSQRPGYRAAVVGLRIGEMAGVDPESLQFAFDALVSGSELEPLSLNVEWAPRPQDCLDFAFLVLEEL